MAALFETEPKMKVTALAPWFGSNRMLGPEVGKELRGCEWVGIPFSGGMAEVPHIKARALLVNDLHRDIINLAQVVAVPAGREWLKAEAAAAPFHPDVLLGAQNRCKELQAKGDIDCERALWYFMAVWMGRSAMAGTDDEFEGNISSRFTASGGGSNVRYRSAIASLDAWGATLQRCEFSTLDFREFLKKCWDRPNHGLYSDSPFPEAGDGYKHKFTEQDHCDLAGLLADLTTVRVVCRFHDHPLIRDLYPLNRWTWRHLEGGRTQANTVPDEVLIMNGASQA